jgi:hypothetical protein
VRAAHELGIAAQQQLAGDLAATPLTVKRPSLAR